MLVSVIFGNFNLLGYSRFVEKGKRQAADINVVEYKMRLALSITPVGDGRQDDLRDKLCDLVADSWCSLASTDDANTERLG